MIQNQVCGGLENNWTKKSQSVNTVERMKKLK